MEFGWFRFDEESCPTSFVSSYSSSSSSSSSTTSSGAYGYFTEQALRAGFLDARGDSGRFGFMPPMPPQMPLMPPPVPLMPPIPPMLPMPPMTALQREIEKERIREEVMREIEQRKILEEEVRREIEMEQLLALRAERSRRRTRVAPFGVEARAKEELRMDLSSPLSRTSLTGKQQTHLADQKQQLSSKTTNTEEETKPILSSQKIEPRSKSLSSFSEVLPLNQTMIGTKRKAVADAWTNKQPRQIPKDWSCALCQVSSTSEEALNEHLQGKRHKIKAAALVASTTGPKVGSKACGKPNISASSKQDDEINSTVKTVHIQLDGKLHKVQDKGGLLWCDLCKVKTNSTIAMASHLGGRKHTALTRNSEKKRKKQAAEGAAPEPEIKEDERSVTTESVTKGSLEKENNSGSKDTEKDLMNSDGKETEGFGRLCHYSHSKQRRIKRKEALTL